MLFYDLELCICFIYLLIVCHFFFQMTIELSYPYAIMSIVFEITTSAILLFIKIIITISKFKVSRTIIQEDQFRNL